VRGVTVTWLEPWLFNTGIPRDIDISVMMTFLDMHAALIRFVLFRLYNEAGLAYPPALLASSDAAPPVSQVTLSRLTDASEAAGPAGDETGDVMDTSAFLDSTRMFFFVFWLLISISWAWNGQSNISRKYERTRQRSAVVCLRPASSS
jgi:hypothetical protein